MGHSEVASATGADLESARPSQGGPAEGDFESVVPRQEELERLHYRLLRLYLQVSNEATGWPFFFRKGWRSNRIESDLTGSLRPRRLASGALARWLIELHVKRISKQLALSYLRLEQVLKPSDDSASYSNFVKQARESVERFAGSFSSFHRPRIVLTTVWPLLLALGVKVSLPEANQTLIAVLILIPLLIYLGPVTHFVLRASFLLKRELMLASGGEDGGAYQAEDELFNLLGRAKGRELPVDAIGNSILVSGVVAIAIVIIAYAVGPPYADDVAGALGGITIVSAIAVYLVSLGERPWR